LHLNLTRFHPVKENNLLGKTQEPILSTAQKALLESFKAAANLEDLAARLVIPIQLATVTGAKVISAHGYDAYKITIAVKSDDPNRVAREIFTTAAGLTGAPVGVVAGKLIVHSFPSGILYSGIAGAAGGVVGGVIASKSKDNVAANGDVAFFDRYGGALHIYKGSDYIGCFSFDQIGKRFNGLSLHIYDGSDYVGSSSFDYNEMFDEPLPNLDEVGSFGFDHVSEQVNGIPGRYTYDPATVKDWYADGTDNRIELIETTDGLTLYHTDAEQLVQAMAAFTPPAAAQTSWMRPQDAGSRILLAALYRGGID
jgi:hypothetical protein